jgi:hypothetical protein
VSWVPAEARHVAPLIAQLGDERRAELISICEQASMPPEEMMIQALNNSRETFCYIDDDGEPITIIGCIPVNGRAVVWMVGVEARIENHKKFFLAESRRWITAAAGHYGILCANVAKAEKKSLRWMDWMGFRRVGEVMAFGREAWQLERPHD